MYRALLALLVGLLAAGCAPAPGEQIANRIRAAGSPVVREVIFRPANLLDPASIDVWLIPGAPEAQAEAVWCEVIAPAGGSAYDEGGGVAVWNDSGTELMAVDPVCATPSN